MKILRRTAALLVLPLLTACGGGSLTSLAESVLYPFSTVDKKYPVPNVPPEGVEQVYFDLADSDGQPMTVHAWYSKAAGPQARTLIHFHGNGENLTTMDLSGLLKVYTAIGLNYVVIDYPGLGRSSGHPNQENLTRAGEAAVDFARQTWPRSHLIIWGRSLGAAVATQVAYRKQNVVRGLILTSPWNRFMDVATNMTSMAKDLPPEWVAQHAYDSQALAPNIHLPVLIHHGLKDKTIPIKFGRLLFGAFTGGDDFMREFGDKEHNDMYQDRQLWDDVRAFNP